MCAAIFFGVNWHPGSGYGNGIRARSGAGFRRIIFRVFGSGGTHNESRPCVADERYNKELGLVFGVLRGALLLLLSYLVAQLFLPVERWPPSVLRAQALTFVSFGAKWLISELRLVGLSSWGEQSICAAEVLRSSARGYAIFGPVPPPRAVAGLDLKKTNDRESKANARQTTNNGGLGREK